jgi:hypothetical protein
MKGWLLVALGAAGVAGCGDCGPPASDAAPPGDAAEAATDAGATDSGSDGGPGSCPVASLPDAGTLSLGVDIQPIFTDHCITCHYVGGIGAGLVLEPGMTWGSAVNVPAAQVVETSMLDRVEPGAPDLSYLVHKLQGTYYFPAVGGSGTRMPSGMKCLDPMDIALIRAWIEQGALDN